MKPVAGLKIERALICSTTRILPFVPIVTGNAALLQAPLGADTLKKHVERFSRTDGVAST
jgi:hypothetical protein